MQLPSVPLPVPRFPLNTSATSARWSGCCTVQPNQRIIYLPPSLATKYFAFNSSSRAALVLPNGAASSLCCSVACSSAFCSVACSSALCCSALCCSWPCGSACCSTPCWLALTSVIFRGGCF